MLVQRPVVRARSHRASIASIVVSIAVSACAGGGGGESAPLTPTVSPPSVAPPAQFADGTKSFGATSDRNLALPLYGISLPFAAVVAPGTIFAGRRLETDNTVSVTFESAAGASRSVRFAASAASPFTGTSTDVDYLEMRALGSTPTALDFVRFGALAFTSPTDQAIAFYGGFETPAGAGPVAGTLSYVGTTGALDVRGPTSTALSGSIHLEADFQSNTVFGSINNLKTLNGAGAVVGDYDYRFLLSNVTIANAGGSRTFAGALVAEKLSDASTVTSGNSIVDGRFFGNTAQEAGGVWQSDAIGGRQVWGSFGATTSAVSGSSSFLQSVGTPLTLSDRTSFEVNVISNAVTAIASAPGSTVTPLANGGLTFSGGALGTFNPPGSATAPQLSTTAPYVASTGATALTGATAGGGVPSLVYLAERGTLSYARFGYWIDGSRVAANDVLEHSFFAGGVQTPVGAMPSSGTATYVGTTLGTVVDNTNAKFDFAGKVNLVADFGARGVSGSIHSLVGSSLPLTSITLGGGNIPVGANTFAGTATALDGATTVGAGSFNGRFYGPAANEAAGTWTLDGGGGSLKGWGSYGAGR